MEGVRAGDYSVFACFSLASGVETEVGKDRRAVRYSSFTGELSDDYQMIGGA